MFSLPKISIQPMTRLAGERVAFISKASGGGFDCTTLRIGAWAIFIETEH